MSDISFETGFLRLVIDYRAEWSYPSEQVHLVGRSEVRTLSPARKTRTTHHGLARGGYPSAHQNSLEWVKRLNPRRVKLHRSYSVDEVARLFKVHKNTVRAWVKAGPADDRRSAPAPDSWTASGGFSVHARRRRNKQRCRAGTSSIASVAGRPKSPAVRMVDYVPITASAGNLRGLCPDCGCLMHRRVSSQKLTSRCS